MEKTLFEEMFHRRPHPVLRLLGNLALCAAQLIFVIAVITHFHSAWRWLVIPLGLWAMVADGRGVALAVQDLRRRGAAPAPE
ncbi:hypothetical protein [Streptomyces sp. H27-S2]|uniref:hypothetical protein n=1 Tax=Streptomyces antarcticus TaxID=2996458 RepID=UPI002270A7BE|nr:hypothetical protein [Streptomyces sp. H27-S2]MCY0954283.1 hypothetical protein [Streptomyces sp. H27-S2]